MGNERPGGGTYTIVLVSVLFDVLSGEVVVGVGVAETEAEVEAEVEIEELELVDMGVVVEELDVSGGGVVEEGDVVGGVVVGGDVVGGGVVVGVPEGVVVVLGSEEPEERELVIERREEGMEDRKEVENGL